MYTAVYVNPFDKLYNLMDVVFIIDMEEIYAELLDEKAVQGVIISSTDGIPINYLFKGKKPSNIDRLAAALTSMVFISKEAAHKLLLFYIEYIMLFFR